MAVTIAAATFAASRLLKKLVGPQPQEAELLKVLVVILVHAHRSVT